MLCRRNIHDDGGVIWSRGVVRRGLNGWNSRWGEWISISAQLGELLKRCAGRWRISVKVLLSILFHSYLKNSILWIFRVQRHIWCYPTIKWVVFLQPKLLIRCSYIIIRRYWMLFVQINSIGTNTAAIHANTWLLEYKPSLVEPLVSYYLRTQEPWLKSTTTREIQNETTCCWSINYRRWVEASENNRETNKNNCKELLASPNHWTTI